MLKYLICLKDIAVTIDSPEATVPVRSVLV